MQTICNNEGYRGTRQMITEYQISDGTQNLSIKIIRSKRKSIGLEVKADGSVLARIPWTLTDKELEKFLEEHKGWILKKVKLLEERQKDMEPSRACPVRELLPEDIVKIKKKFSERVQYYSSRMGVTYERITVRNQKTRWGSCSAKGNLNFNYQLYYLPEELFDYVVVHELAHRKHMNHSAAFWEEVGRYYPDYKGARERLKKIEMGRE